MRLACVLGATVLALVLVGRASPSTQPKLLVGVDDDTAKWLAQPNGLVAVDRALGVGAVRMMLPWNGQAVPSRRQQTYLHRVGLSLALGDRIVLSVYGRAADAPLTPYARKRFCGFTAHVLQRLPAIEDVVIWNEANNPTFWPQRAGAGAGAYEQLLATCWDRLHGLRGSIDVLDSTAPHQDPARFIAGLGAAYRASGRTRPILDTYGHNAYPESSAEEPWAQHTNGSIDEGDYPHLVQVLDAAFAGTAQPLPGQGTTRIWYLEDGFQTVVPQSKRRFYTGVPPHKTLIEAGSQEPDGSQTGLVPDQADQLRAAVELAYCQPDVGGFFNFQLLDDHKLSGWQSGLLWADGTEKPAYAAFQQAIAAVAAGQVDCAALPAAAQ